MKTRFIAEISSNHNQDIARTLSLIDEAKRVGCWAVKFQLFKAELLYHKSFKAQIEKMKKWELPESFLPIIRRRCDKLGLKFICTPFDLEAVETLIPFVDYFKVGSYELLWDDLIKAIIKTGKLWMLSTGMDGVDKIRGKKWKGKKINPCYAILHCNSNYPAKPENCNLDQITKNQAWFHFQKHGWSDHTVEPGIIYKAISLGAEFIEFHFDLESMLGFESSVGHCWPPRKIKQVIDNVRIGEMAEVSKNTAEQEASKWRTDPIDGLRPLREYRKELGEKNII